MSRNDYDDMNTSFKRSRDSGNKKTYVFSFMGVLIILIAIILYLLFSPSHEEDINLEDVSINSSSANDIEINIPQINEVTVERSTPIEVVPEPVIIEEVETTTEEEESIVEEVIEEEAISYHMPSDGTLVYNFGDEYNGRELEGITFSGTPGSAVYAVFDGVVSDTGRDDTFGRYIRIQHPNGYRSSYYCLEVANLVKLGESVMQGSVIGTIGTSNQYFGSPMLYFILEEGSSKVDPLSIVK